MKKRVAGLSLFLVVLLLSSLLLVEAQKHTVGRLPTYPDGAPAITSFTGYLKVRDDMDANLFYWYFPVEDTTKTNAPLILWLNGGPGCSSLIGALFENGPYAFDKDKLTVSKNPYAWNQIGNVLYFDQPVGVGFAYAESESAYVDNSADAAQHVFIALQKFIQAFPEVAGKDFYIAGESYAGKYVPHIYKVISQNKKDFPLNIKGVMLGNAMIQPSIQYQSYAPHGYASGISSYRQRVEMSTLYETCMDDIANKDVTAADEKSCIPLFSNMVHSAGNLSPFDIRQHISAVYAEDTIKGFLNRTDVQQALGVNPKYNTFHKCFAPVHSRFMGEFHQDLPEELMLNMLTDINVLLYNGQFDARVSAHGTAEMLRRLNWQGREVFNEVAPTVFKINGDPRGNFKKYLSLTQFVVFGGSHLAPETRPETCLEMIKRYIASGSLCDEVNCDRFAFQCPNQCSNHGTCDGLTCSCNKGYSGADCSIGTFEIEESTKPTSFMASMHGKEAVVYRLKLMKPSAQSIDITVEMDNLSETGLPYIFLNTGLEKNAVSALELRRIARKKVEWNLNGITSKDLYFPHYNLTHSSHKVLAVKEAPVISGTSNVIDLVVMNNADAPANLRLTFSCAPSAGKLNWFWVLIVLSALGFIIIILELAVIIGKHQARKKLQSSSAYQHLVSNNAELQSTEEMEMQPTH